MPKIERIYDIETLNVINVFKSKEKKAKILKPKRKVSRRKHEVVKKVEVARKPTLNFIDQITKIDDER